MNEGVAKIVRLERRVMWRRRLLSLQDGLALSLAIGGIIAAGLVLLVRLRPFHIPVWAVIIGALGLSLGAALTRWFFTRAHERDAAFLIDESLGLEDRVATSNLIIERGGPGRALEEALIEDTAERAGNQAASSVVPYRMRPWHALSLVSLIALVAALMITPRSLPVTEALAAERRDIDNAADHLERTAAEVEQVVPAETETAGLAKEQAELGRGFRRSATTRAEALRRLSGFEERIRRRHDDLATTKADEIVSLADRRIGGALSTLSTAQRKKLKPDESQLAVSAEGPAGDPKLEPGKETQAGPPSGGLKALDSSREKAPNSGSTASHDRARSGDQPKVEDVSAKKQQEASEAQRRPQEPVSGQGAAAESAKVAPRIAGEPGTSADKMPGGQEPGELKADAEKPDEQKNVEREKGDQQPSDKSTGGLDALKAVPNSMAEQAAKALPKLSEELLNKAAQLRANELSPADIEKLRQAAESLSRDLAQIAQSKDLQQALRDMARQIRPEEIEQVARELGNQEKLKQELESAARLLTENQKAKEMVAGLAGQFARVRDEKRQQQPDEKAGGQHSGGKSDSRNEQAGARDLASRSGTGKSPSKLTTMEDRRLKGQGRESSLQGKHQQGSGGEYLFLESKPGVGAARAPYSSAYPRYRREAERSVQRTQVPPNLRSVVRKYFDAINPDAKR
ncbi:MAG: hypothetical protein AABN33_24980 [Acidobacteriota bacterium]